MCSTRPSLWLTLAVTAYTLAAASACGGSQYPQGPVPQPSGAPTYDPPGRVGRLSYIDGPVSFLPAGADSWAVAEPNRPVTTGDRLWADDGARAEIDIGSTMLRLSAQTEVDVLRITDHWVQVRLPQGNLNHRMRVLPPDQDAEIDTPNAAISLIRAGSYKVSVSPDGWTTTVTVWSGEAEVTASGSTFPVQARQVATVHGNGQLTYDLTDAGVPDDFDRWAAERDARADRITAALQYVSDDMPGYEDLDSYGGWATDVDYGPIWYPVTIVAGWAPYRYGHWVWVGRWGWTWVDDAPWGFAPYHYGRWAFVHGRWGWCPGRMIARPVYAPALVVFIGGSGWSVSASFGPGGGVGWFPLAPGEVYYPAYAHGAEYRRRINVGNVTNVTVINNITVTNVDKVKYRNRDVRGAVTAVPAKVFVAAEPVRRAAVEVPSRDLTTARVLGAAPVTPASTSLVAGVPGRRAAPPPAALATRPAVATHAPPPTPVPFALQQRELQTNGGRPLTPAQLAGLRQTAPAAGPAGPPVRSAETPVPGAGPLTPARPRLPVTPQPADKVFAPTPPAAAAPQRPAERPPAVAPNPPAPPAKPAPRPQPSPLDQSYQAERASTESRHRQEFARPPAGETTPVLSQRQEAEHQDLEQRYERAREKGMSAMPPKAAGKPQPKPQQPAEKKPSPKP